MISLPSPHELSLRTQGPIRRAAAFWHVGRRLPYQRTPGVMGPSVRRDDVLRLLFGLMGVILAWSLGASSAQAHPHVWITAKSELVYAPDGSITGVRHAWTFDEMFTTYALQGLANKTKGVYTREELAPLAQTNVELLKEFNFFTFAKADGKKEKFVEPVNYFLEYKDSELTPWLKRTNARCEEASVLVVASESW